MKFQNRLLFCTVLVFTFWAQFLLAQELAKKNIEIGNKKITVEIAKTNAEMAKGLMFRKELKPDHGMLFIYESEQELKFWMKNTFIPLSIGFFNKNRELIDVQEMIPVTSEMQIDIPTYTSKGLAMYALEMPQGWFKKNKIKICQKRGNNKDCPRLVMKFDKR